jgi:Xaa-Pro aminopeptidase
MRKEKNYLSCRIENIKSVYRDKIYPDGAILSTSKINNFYLTGIPLDGYWVLITSDKTFLLPSLLLKEHLETLKPTDCVIYFTTKATSIFTLLLSLIKDAGIKKLIADASEINYKLGDNLRKYLNRTKTKLEFIDNLFHKIRVIKDATEIENIKKACQLAKDTLNYIINNISPKLTQKDLAYMVEKSLYDKNDKSVNGTAFPTIIAPGKYSSYPHHMPINKKINHPEILLIDLGVKYNSYCSDITRTLIYRTVDSKMEKIYKFVEELQQKIIEMIKPGIPCKVLNQRYLELIKKNNYTDYYLHNIGHGVGLEIHEAPDLGAITGSNETLQPGMVFTIEPGLYVKNKFGIRIEDTILVTQKGYEILTR